jgi:hypothetical protein
MKNAKPVRGKTLIKGIVIFRTECLPVGRLGKSLLILKDGLNQKREFCCIPTLFNKDFPGYCQSVLWFNGK